MAAISQTTFSNVFINEMFCIFIQILQKSVPKCLIENKSAMV